MKRVTTRTEPSPRCAAERPLRGATPPGGACGCGNGHDAVGARGAGVKVGDAFAAPRARLRWPLLAVWLQVPDVGGRGLR